MNATLKSARLLNDMRRCFGSRNIKAEADILAMVRTDSDTRSTASGVACATVPVKVAAKLAKQIDARGNDGAGEYLAAFELKEGCRLACGHGVTVRYASGALRTYNDAY